MFQKNLQVSLLLDFYGDILPDRKRAMTSLYYNDDLSLAEIAEICGISRQGVRDAIKKSEAELIDLENKLGLAGRFQALRAQLRDISAEINIIAEESQDKEKLTAISKRLSELNI